MIQVLALTGSAQEAHQLVLLARVLEPRGIRFHIAADRRCVYESVVAEGYEHTFCKELTAPTGPPRNVTDYLPRYTSPTVAEMVASEQVIRDWPREQKVQTVCEFLDTWEKFFDERGIDVVLKAPTCSCFGRSAYAVARRRGKCGLIINTGPIVSETFTLNDIDEGNIWSELFETYYDPNSTVSEDQRRWIDEKVAQITAETRRAAVGKRPSFPRAVRCLLKYVYHRARGRMDAVELNELRKEMSFAFGALRKPVRYVQVRSDRPYIFFPLHIPWDAQIATRNPMFSSQQAIVEMLSMACPPGVRLYIKEHPYFAGGVNRRMLRAVRHLDNVEVLAPRIPSLDVVQDAAVVVTINSTAGWEAICRRKPVVVLGDPFYSYFRHVWKVNNVNDLPRILNAAYTAGPSAYDDADEWYKFLHAAVTSAHAGSMVLYKKYMGHEKDLSAERIGRLADELEAKIRKVSSRGPFKKPSPPWAAP